MLEALACSLFGVSLALLVGTTHAATYTLHHRIGTSSWSKRGVIQTVPAADASSYSVSPHYVDLTGEQSAPWRALAGYDTWSEELYQLALTPDGKDTVDEDTSPMTFARLCHLASDANESFTLHTDSTGDDVVGISYDLLGLDETQLDAKGCLKQHTPAYASPSSAAKNVHIQINKPQAPLSPLPPAAPPTKQDGTPLAPGEEPPVEQSFFRKYWYYILPVVALMLIPTEIADANNEESEGGGDGTFSSGAPKAGRGAVAGASGGNVRRR